MEGRSSHVMHPRSAVASGRPWTIEVPVGPGGAGGGDHPWRRTFSLGTDSTLLRKGYSFVLLGTGSTTTRRTLRVAMIGTGTMA